MANIIIDSVKLTPDVVNPGQTFIISVGIKDKVYAILDSKGRYIKATSNKAIEKSPRRD